MKYVVVLGDGMADCPVPQLDNKTPLQYAVKPNIDFLARNGRLGLVKTIPGNVPPGSDAANLSVLGYSPLAYYTGRAPLEAVSMGLELAEEDVAFRCNLVTLSPEEPYQCKTMLDYSSDEISSEEAAELIKVIDGALGNDLMSFHAGISYRHCMVWKAGPVGLGLTPPHDILERNIEEHLPRSGYGDVLRDMMRKSYELLDEHPVNVARRSRGLRPANSVWLWGEGKKPAIPSFFEKYRLKGSVISAVDLIKGIGLCAGLDSIDVKGATGNIHTNFRGKAEAALAELERGKDFVYVHVEAPDECGHRYEIDNKVRAIERIDDEVVGTIMAGLERHPDYRIMVLPDHPTPLSLRTHTREPVPFLIYQNNREAAPGAGGYDEESAARTGLFVDEGHTLMDLFISGGL